MKRQLSKQEQLTGTLKAIRNLKRKKKGPVWLIPSLERFAKKLRDEIRSLTEQIKVCGKR